MPQIWVRDAEAEARDWAVAVLGPPAASERFRHTFGDAAELNGLPADTADRGVVLTAPGATALVNGLAIIGGFGMLRDRDELRVGRDASPVYFSTERAVAIAPFAAAEGATPTCPRCRQGLEPGAASVRCPGCGVAHHQSEDLACWTYAPGCAVCGRTTDLDAGFAWTPEMAERGAR